MGPGHIREIISLGWTRCFLDKLEEMASERGCCPATQTQISKLLDLNYIEEVVMNFRTASIMFHTFRSQFIRFLDANLSPFNNT